MPRSVAVSRHVGAWLSVANCLPLWAAGLVAGSCALPEVQRESARQRVGDAGVTADKDAAPTEPARDPYWDPDNRNEDLATFQALVPTAHLFAEWPMPDSLPGSGHPPSYKDSGSVVIDNLTKLRWQKSLPDIVPGCKGRHEFEDELLEEGSGCTWEEAHKYCSSDELARSLGGGTWRLPTLIELETLLDFSRTRFIPEIFESSYDDFYWTGSPAPNPTSVKLSWAVDFMEGNSFVTGRYKAGRVRCVSSERADGGGEPSFTVQEKSLTDWTTRLLWQRQSDSAARNWEEARQYCADLQVDQARGWRLPSLKELLTLVDTRRFMPAIDQRAFFLTQQDRFWTSTGFPPHLDQAFAVEFKRGESYHFDRSDRHYVRCVR